MSISPANTASRNATIPADGETGLSQDMRAIWLTFRRHHLLFWTSIIATLLVALIYLLLATPRYEATALVQIEEQSTRVLKSEDMDAGRNPMDADRFLQTQLDIIRSRTLALAVAQELNLIGNKQFLETMTGNSQVRTIGVLDQRNSERETVLKILNDNLGVSLPVDSRVASIKFISPDPALSAKIANAFADNFIRSNMQRKYDTSAYAREFLEKQLAVAKQQLEGSERDALGYAAKARLIDASNGAKSTEGGDSPKSLTVARLVSLNAAYAAAVSRRMATQQKWEQARGVGLLNLTEVLQNPAIQVLVQKRAEAQANYQDQRQARKDDFPTVRQARAQVIELDGQIDKLASNIRSSMRSEYEAAKREEDALQARMGTLEADTLSEQSRNVQMSILTRASDTNRTLYDTLLQRYRELSAESGIQPNNLSIIDRADVPPKPVSPRVALTLLTAVFAGMGIGALLIFARSRLDDAIRSSGDLQAKLGIPLLGIVPEVKPAEQLMSDLDDSKSAVSEAFSSIRASLQLSSSHGIPRTLLLTSTQPSEGKSTTIYALAVGLARIGKKVLVIDCDMRRPRQHHNFNMANKIGMSDLIVGQKTSGEVIRQTHINNVSLITCGSIPPNPTELLSSAAFDAELASLGQQFDIVLLDAPPILGLADAVLLGAKVDATVLVVESGRNHYGGARAAVGRLQSAGSNLIGAILTKQDIRASGYGYDGYYYYNYGEGQSGS